jgi:hypothetical protein
LADSFSRDKAPIEERGSAVSVALAADLGQLAEYDRGEGDPEHEPDCVHASSG